MEEEGKIIEVPTKPGKNDRHYENSGRFAPKDGVGSETTENEHEFDDLDLDKIFSDPANADIFNIKLDWETPQVENPQVETPQAVNPQDEEFNKLQNQLSTAREKLLQEAKNSCPQIFSQTHLNLFQDNLRECLDNCYVTSRIPTEYILDLIVSGKIKNQFEAKHSEGKSYAKNPSGGARAVMANKFFGYDIKDFTFEKGAKFEKYGTICPKDDFNFLFDSEEYGEPDDMAAGYGNTICIFKDSIKKVTTFTLGDSLEAMEYNDIIVPINFVDGDINEYCATTEFRENWIDNEENPIENFQKANVARFEKLADFNYFETQIHVPDLNIEDYVSAIAIDEKDLNNPKFKNKIIEAMSVSKEKYPNLKFFSRDENRIPKRIYLTESNRIEFDKEEFTKENIK